MHKFRPGDKNSRETTAAFYERFLLFFSRPPTSRCAKKYLSAARMGAGQKLCIHGHELTQTENG